MVAVFLVWERRVERPVLDLSLFDNRIYNFSVLAAMLQSLAMFATNFLVVFYLQAVRGYDPLTAALLLIPLSIVSAVVGPLSGLLADHIGARAPATAGVLIQAVALLWFVFKLTPVTPYGSIVVGLVLVGVGGGLFWSPNTSAAMNAAPRDRLGIASAALATLRQTGMVTSFALALAVAAGSLPRDVMMKIFVGTSVSMGSGPMQAFVVGIRHAFVVSIVLCLIAAGLSLVRGAENRRAWAGVYRCLPGRRRDPSDFDSDGGSFMALMRAIQVKAPGAELEMVRKEIPEPKPNEVLIKVEACGICHGDAVVRDGHFPGITTRARPATRWWVPLRGSGPRWQAGRSVKESGWAGMADIAFSAARAAGGISGRARTP